MIKFINLPPECTLRIFNVSGRLIRTLYLNEGQNHAFNGKQSHEWYDYLGFAEF